MWGVKWERKQRKTANNGARKMAAEQWRVESRIECCYSKSKSRGKHKQTHDLCLRRAEMERDGDGLQQQQKQQQQPRYLQRSWEIEAFAQISWLGGKPNSESVRLTDRLTVERYFAWPRAMCAPQRVRSGGLPCARLHLVLAIRSVQRVRATRENVLPETLTNTLGI